VAVLLTINSAVVRFVSRHDWAVRMFEGSNTTLVKDGRYIESALRREGLRHSRRGDHRVAQAAGHGRPTR
jgi:uncharacterized membrane protein YcaP (DUF421 family)